MLSYTSPYRTIPHNQHRSIDLQNAPAVSSSSSAMRNLSLKPILSSFASNRHCRVAARKLSSVRPDPLREMEAKGEPNRGDNFDEKEKVEEEEKRKAEKEKEIPPPPEKPEAGDCCGSGCVRCVWDVYYEELEDYNKMYEAASRS